MKQADSCLIGLNYVSVETTPNSCVSREVPPRTVLMLITFISSDFIFFWITDSKAGKGERLGIDSETVKTEFTVTEIAL